MPKHTGTGNPDADTGTRGHADPLTRLAQRLQIVQRGFQGTGKRCARLAPVVAQPARLPLTVKPDQALREEKATKDQAALARRQSDGQREE